MSGHERFLLRIAYIVATIMALLICIKTMETQPLFSFACAAIGGWAVFELTYMEAGEEG